MSKANISYRTADPTTSHVHGSHADFSELEIWYGTHRFDVLEDRQYLPLTGLTKVEFDTVVELATSRGTLKKTKRSSPRNTIGMLYFKLKHGIGHEALAALFGHIYSKMPFPTPVPPSSRTQITTRHAEHNTNQHNRQTSPHPIHTDPITSSNPRNHPHHTNHTTQHVPSSNTPRHGQQMQSQT